MNYLEPFVLTVDSAQRERLGRVDLYLPEHDGPRPAVVIVHGGPLPADVSPTPRDWPLFVGYGNAMAARGFVGVTVDHRMHGFADYPQAAADVAAAIELARQDPRVDGNRIALWFFSGSGQLLAEWLREPSEWLRCIGLSYPLLAPLPGWEVDERFRPIEAVGTTDHAPIVLTTVGLERDEITATVVPFVKAACERGAPLDVIHVPDGHHGFDSLDHTEQSRAAVEQAIQAVLATLR